MKSPKVFRIFPLGFYLWLIFLTSSAFGLDNSTVVGKYELQGVMEMAGMLVLKPDQKYTAQFAYGAADWIEEGTWKIEGDEVVVSNGRFKAKNYKELSLFLAPGMKMKYKDGKLTSSDPERKFAFLDPNKTPTPPGKEAGEGRMRVKGKVMSIDNETLVIKTEECLTLDVGSLSDKVVQMAKANQGKTIDVEIPFSSIISGGSCP